MRQNGLDVQATGRCREIFWACALASLLLAGCGAEAYERRLTNTAKLFTHMNLVNANLQGVWSDPETGISLRAPLKFVVVPPPVKPEPDPAEAKEKANEAAKGEAMEEEEEEELPDDRQPDYVNVELPGMRGAFKTPVKMISTGNAEAADGQAFIYVLSNHDLAEKPDEAKEFKNEFVKNLGELLHVPFDPDKDSRDEKFPTGDPSTNGFVNPVKYWNVTITSPEEIAGYVRIFSAYIYEQADIQVIVLFVLPADTDSSENLVKRIPLCLETLSVFGERLSLPRKSGPAAGTAQGSQF